METKNRTLYVPSHVYHMHSHSHTHTHTHTLTHTHTHTHLHTHTLTYTHTHSHTHSLKHTHTHTLTLTLTLTHTHTHTHTHTLTHTLTHTHTHTSCSFRLFNNPIDCVPWGCNINRKLLTTLSLHSNTITTRKVTGFVRTLPDPVYTVPSCYLVQCCQRQQIIFPSV
jgi:hypothetical protein